MILFAQQPAPETTSPPQEVTISPEQMAQLGEQINGAGLFVGGIQLVAVFALGILMLVAVVGGR